MADMQPQYGFSQVAAGVYGRGATLEALTPGARVRSVVVGSAVTVISAQWHGSNAITLTYRDDTGSVAQTLLYRGVEPSLIVEQAARAYAFDGDPNLFRLAAEALRIRMAARFDPMLAVTTSDLEPLPHQIKAVYGELLPRTPLRFLLADDPGAGKTIMAGLYIKELMLRGDLARCLIVAPGSLVEQWQEELLDKFGIRFELLTRSLVDSTPDENVFERHPLLLARMDQLSRSEELRSALEHADYDLVVVDEAHRMSAHYFGAELKTTKRYDLGRLLGRVTRHLLLMTATPHAGKEEDFQLFPERVANTLMYDLSPPEAELYEAVTDYVREQMNRAEQLKHEGEGRRGNTVGFALTVLQRRLASSPEAILRSLDRRRRRLAGVSGLS